MEKIIKKIEIEIENLRIKIQKRHDKVYDMSDKWQESEKCEEWIDKTEEIEECLDQLVLVIDDLNELK